MTAATPRLDARDIAGMVTIRQMLRHLGWRVRSRSRADCGLCRGSSKGTLPYRERVWHCHRCHAGGGVFSLVQAVQGCDFPAALAKVANLAGMRIGGRSGDDWRRQVADRQQQWGRVDAAADKLAQAEHALWLECRDRIHECDRVLAKPGPWDERQWQRMQAACLLRDEYLLPAYTLLSW